MGCLWQRELLRFARERTRWAGAVAQPLLFWVIIGSGMAPTFVIEGAEDVSALRFFFPGILAMIVLFTTIFTTISVVEDRQQGFLQGVLVAPGSRASLVVGKVLGVVTLTLLQSALLLVFAPLAGFALGRIHWGELVLVLAVSAAGLTAMNFTVAWWLDSVQAYHAIMSVVLIPLWFLSGALFPRPGGWLDVVMTLNPLTHAVDAYRHALEGGRTIATAGGFGTSLAVLAAYGAVMMLVAVAACRRGGAS